MTSRSIKSLVGATLFAIFLAGGIAQQKSAPKKSYVLMGKVESMDKAGNTLTVNHGNIEGYMAAMTMPYKVDKPDVFTKVKAGDQIKATVYDGDYTLYNVEVLPAASVKKK
jgi:Cu/Ag efflux protein CusF